MTSHFRQIAMVLLCLILISYMGFLLADLYNSRSTLQSVTRSRLLDDNEKRATAIGYFFSERINDINDLSENRELSAFFENQALGMSMEYGLASSLDALKASFSRFQKKKLLNNSLIYKRLAFIDKQGNVLIDSVSGSDNTLRDDLNDVKPLLPQNGQAPSLHIVGKNLDARIIISRPYIFNDRPSGFIVGWMNPAEIFTHFLSGISSRENPIILTSERQHILCIPPESENLISKALIDKAASFKYGQEVSLSSTDSAGSSNTIAFRTSIPSTPFSIVMFTPADRMGVSSPRKLAAASAAIGILILAGAFIIVRSGIRTSVLNARLEETSIREQAAEEQNRLLQTANQIAEAARISAEESEQLRAKSEEHLKLVLDGSNDGIWDWDVPSGRLTVNLRWLRIFGYSGSEDQVISIETFIGHIHPDDQQMLSEHMKVHLAGDNEPFEIEFRIITNSGDTSWILARGKVVELDHQGKSIRLAGTHTDITKRKTMEASIAEKTQALESEIFKREITQQQLALNQKALETFNINLKKRVDESVAELRKKDQVLINQSRQAAMGEMIGNIAHQWRQPLNALSMLIFNIQFAHKDNELTPEFLDSAVNTANRLIQKMSTTINDFRNFFSPDKEMVTFSLLEQVKHVVELVHASFANSNIEIKISCNNDCLLKGFPNEYSQVLLNLLSNAKDAILERGVIPGSIAISVEELSSQGTVIIRDNGGGIPEDCLGKIFEPYFSTKNMGTGIGLYMSKMIIERNMNGTIRADNIDSGAEFRVSIPLEKGSP